MRVALIGGTFDGDGGKSSGLITKIAGYLDEHELVGNFGVMNGGHIQDLITEYEQGDSMLKDADVIMWFVNVPNEFEKYRDLKSKYPRKMLVTSKRNFGEYSFSYLVNHALMLKSNLVLEFSKGEDNKFNGRVLDPLAVVWHDYDDDFSRVIDTLINRLEYLRNVTRLGTKQAGGKVEVTVEDKYLEVVQGLASTFHELIKPVDGVTRFLGNTSFRCRHGFPSFRDGELIYVSRRNIDKRELGKDGFVPVRRGKDNRIEYFGEHKPSVDTPIQLRLYEHYKNVNYMVHSHVYIDGAPYTENAVPCGGMEEVDEILKLYPSVESTNFVVNLIGHGSLILASDVNNLEELASNYIARPVPEIL